MTTKYSLISLEHTQKAYGKTFFHCNTHTHMHTNSQTQRHRRIISHMHISKTAVSVLPYVPCNLKSSQPLTSQALIREQWTPQPLCHLNTIMAAGSFPSCYCFIQAYEIPTAPCQAVKWVQSEKKTPLVEMTETSLSTCGSASFLRACLSIRECLDHSTCGETASSQLRILMVDMATGHGSLCGQIDRRCKCTTWFLLAILGTRKFFAWLVEYPWKCIKCGHCGTQTDSM